MRPTPIPDEDVRGPYVRQVIAPPDGDLTNDVIRSVEALCALDYNLGCPVFRLRIELDPGDMEKLQAGEPIWLSMLGGVIPFDIEVGNLE